MRFESTKSFSGFPCCHRQWRHEGHCSFVHGYSRSFKFWFVASELDVNKFVVDFSDLKELRARLSAQFDHTFLVNADDPLMDQWQMLADLKAIDLRVMENVGMEYTSKLVWEWANDLLYAKHAGRTCCWRAEARENEHNSALFAGVPAWFNADVELPSTSQEAAI